MPIRSIKTSQETIHVLRGEETQPLIDTPAGTRSIIKFETQSRTFVDAANYLSSNADVTVVLRPIFKGTQTGAEYSGGGVSFNTSTGVIQVDEVAPAIQLRNFIIEVKATDTSGTDDEEYFSYVRFEIHTSVTHAWLTPNRLSLPKNKLLQKFSIYAEFDDGVIGDVSNVLQISWTSPESNRFVLSEGSLLILPSDNVGDEVEITATLPADLGSKVAKGTLVVDSPWDNTNIFTINHVSTGNGPGQAGKNDVPNVLFIAEGFEATDESTFNTQVDDMVEKLSKDSITAPYNILSKDINYWKLFMPSEDAMCSWHSEVYLSSNASTSTAKQVPFAVPTENPTGTSDVEKWKMENLIFFAGLPVPALKNKTVGQLKTIWKGLMRLSDVTATNDTLVSSIDSELITTWKSFNNRRLIEEHDTLFGLKFGLKPKAVIEATDDASIFGLFESRRKERSDFADVFINAVDDSGQSMAGLWEDSSKKDFDLVILLTNRVGGRAVNSYGWMIVPATNGSKSITVEEVPSLLGVSGTHKAMRQKVKSIPNILGINNRGTFVHELSHSFGLGDEYGEPYQKIPTPYLEYNKVNNDVNRYGNVEVERIINVAVDPEADPADFDGDLIKWRWHRIEKCAVLSNTVTTEPGNKLKIPTKGTQASAFAVDDEVFLRERSLNTPLDRSPVLSVLLKVVTVASDHLICELKSHDANDYAAAHLFFINHIIYKPKKAIGAAYNENNFPFAEMITKNVRDFITTNNRPLTIEACAIDDEGLTAPDALPELPGADLCFRNKPRIIGLYSGGMRYHCKVFHPSGTCLMRQQVINSTLTELCSVCRYVMTDIINPSLHPEVDALYTIYPELEL